MSGLRGFIARHRGPVFAGAIVVGIAVITLVTIATSTGGNSKSATTGATTTTATGPKAELVRLLGRAPSVNVDVAYTGTDAASMPFTTHLWRRSPLARVETETGSGDTAKRTAQLVTPSGPFSCTKQGPLPWSCAPKPELKIGDVGVVSPALAARLSTFDVKVSDERLLDQAVRCFTVGRPTAASGTVPTTAASPADASAEVCLTNDGIPVRVTSSAGTLKAVSLERGRPPDSIFQPPA